MITFSIGILEDDDELRRHLTAIVEETDDLTATFSAASLAEARKAIQKTPVDLCLVDIRLPDGSGLEFAADLKSKTETKILIITVLGDRKSVLQALRAGANGYLLKDTSPEQIRRDIYSVLAGDTPINPQAATHLLRYFKVLSPPDETRANKTNADLSNREREILNLFSRGLTYKETADTLGISNNTVSAHVKSIYGKLNVNSKSEAIFEASQLGCL